VAVGRQRCVGEHFAELRLVHDIADVAAKVIGKVAVVGRRDDLPCRLAPQTPGREPLGRQLRLAVPRRHEDHQAVDFPALHRLKLLAYPAVMLGGLVKRVGVFSEAEQAAPGFPALQFPRQPLQLAQGMA
jgi:hypothetical protein